MDMADNPVMKIARKLVDATDTYDGDKFFTTIQGVRKATPMLVVLICIELSDVVFAIDSIPAVVGITQDPFIVYTSNAFALLALRSLYVSSRSRCSTCTTCATRSRSSSASSA